MTVKWPLLFLVHNKGTDCHFCWEIVFARQSKYLFLVYTDIPAYLSTETYLSCRGNSTDGKNLIISHGHIGLCEIDLMLHSIRELGQKNSLLLKPYNKILLKTKLWEFTAVLSDRWDHFHLRSIFAVLKLHDLHASHRFCIMFACSELTYRICTQLL